MAVVGRYATAKNQHPATTGGSNRPTNAGNAVLNDSHAFIALKHDLAEFENVGGMCGSLPFRHPLQVCELRRALFCVFLCHFHKSQFPRFRHGRGVVCTMQCACRSQNWPSRCKDIRKKARRLPKSVSLSAAWWVQTCDTTGCNVTCVGYDNALACYKVMSPDFLLCAFALAKAFCCRKPPVGNRRTQHFATCGMA